jgi:CspA family cold shock protein
MRMTGVVKWFNTSKGFGFISPDDKGHGDAFVHYSNIGGAAGFKNLNEGDRVEYSERVGPKGASAEDVVVTDQAAVSQETRSTLPSGSRR